MVVNNPKPPPLTQCSVFGENSNCDSNRKQNVKEDGRGVNIFTTFQVNSSNSQSLGMTATRNLGSLRMAFYKYRLFSVNVLAVNIAFPFATVFQAISEAASNDA